MVYLILNCSTSINGLYLPEEELFKNNLNQYRVHQLREKADAVITSSRRIKLENPDFKLREHSKDGPKLVVIDKEATIPLDAKIFKNCGKVTLAVSKKAPETRIDKIREHCDVEIIRYGELAVNIREILADLKKRGVEKAILEADNQVNTRFLNNGLVDEIYLMTVPIIVEKGETLFTDIKDRIKLELDGITQYGGHVINHYYVRKDQKDNPHKIDKTKN